MELLHFDGWYMLATVAKLRARNVRELRKGYKTVPRYKKFLVRMNPLEAVRLKSAVSSGARTNHEGPPLRNGIERATFSLIIAL